MVKIKRSVGNKGKNHWIDVMEIQCLINENTHLLKGIEPLLEDGDIGKSTISAIESYQKIVMRISKPDGNIGPYGGTLKSLNKTRKPRSKYGTCFDLATRDNLFPLNFIPAESYKSGMRSFGSSRSKGKRLHAGCDLYAPVGTPIRAMNDGIVMRPVEAFYMRTYVLLIKHDKFVARYGEISHVPNGIKNGAQVKKGQIIAYVGKLKFKKPMSMLHLELYRGDATGPLSTKGNKYQRRADLLDPTSVLDAATK